MAVSPTQAVRRVRRVLARPAGTDGECLGRFLADGDAEAFAELVRRHGPMVLGVCRRVLGNAADADDAFQATFLVLVRKGHAVRPREAVGGFLHAVARRTALHARSAATRRRAARLEDADVPAPAPPADPAADWLPVLDAELAALPEKYRTPVVLCELEGRPLRAVADQLRVPVGTVASRLARGRALLAGRLRKRGLAVTAAAMAAALAPRVAAHVPAALADGLAAPTKHVLELAEGVLKMMLVSKLKGAGRAAVLGLMAAVGLAAGIGPGGPAAPALVPTAAAAPPAKEVVAGIEMKRLDSLWADLEKDEKAATRAVLALSARPAVAVALVRAKLKPLALTEERARALVAALGSEKEEEWKPAFEEMQYFDPRLAIGLEALMADVKDDLPRQRLTAVLAGYGTAPGYYAWCDITLRQYDTGYNFLVEVRANAPADAPADTAAGLYKPQPGAAGPGARTFSTWAEHKVERITRPSWTRAVRAAVLLEHLGTPDAVALLKAMAGGHPDAQPTKAAREALDRIAQSK
jgi:RNA polymerase sigma factor (sigma-70 family)